MTDTQEPARAGELYDEAEAIVCALWNDFFRQNKYTKLTELSARIRALAAAPAQPAVPEGVEALYRDGTDFADEVNPCRCAQVWNEAVDRTAAALSTPHPDTAQSERGAVWTQVARDEAAALIAPILAPYMKDHRQTAYAVQHAVAALAQSTTPSPADHNARAVGEVIRPHKRRNEPVGPSVRWYGAQPPDGTKLYTAPVAQVWDGDFAKGIAFILRNKHFVLGRCAGPTEKYVVEQAFAAIARTQENGHG